MIHELRESTSGKIVLRIALMLLGILSMMSMIWINSLMIALGLYLIVMSLMIKDWSIRVYTDRFELYGKSLLPILNSTEVCSYADIAKIEFSESYTDVAKSVLKSAAIEQLIFYGKTQPSTYTKPDTITIKFTDETFRVINKIGSKKQFLACFKYILENIQK